MVGTGKQRRKRASEQVLSAYDALNTQSETRAI
jgi:hypothetical protein